MGLNKRLIGGAAGGAVPVNTDNFDVVTYTGTNNSTSVSISSLDFQPDLIIHKVRNDSWSHWLYDSVRGAGGSTELQTNSSAAEGGSNNETYGYLASFDSNGFTSGVGVNDGQYFNGSGKNFVAWCFKGGGSSNTFNINGTGYSTASAAGLSISTGSLLGASVNSDAGFGIYKIDPGNTTNDANTITHRLGGEPELIITKRLGSTGNWYSYTKTTGTNKYLFLNTSDAQQGSATTWGVSSTTFSAYTDQSLYTDNTIIYAFRSVDGYQKVGTYGGNGSTQTIDVGFEPRFVMFKRTDSTGEWTLIDSERNNGDNWLYANLSNTEGANINRTTLVSNGFALDGNSSSCNESGSTYIYLAIA